jgi:hypothetical protein
MAMELNAMHHGLRMVLLSAMELLIIRVVG